MAASASASGLAVRRLRREFECLQRSQNSQLAVRPSEDNLLEWHFVLRNLPEDTPYHGGCYHGKILFPAQYPHAPPAIVMITPSGRLEIGKRLCLSMTDFHPESWNPAWSVETILLGLLSFFISDKEEGYGAITDSEAKRKDNGAITTTEARRKEFATESHAVNARNAEFRSLFPEFANPVVQEVDRVAAAEQAEQAEQGKDGDSCVERHGHAAAEGPAPQPVKEEGVEVGEEAAPCNLPPSSATPDDIEADSNGSVHGVTEADVEAQRQGEEVEAPASGGDEDEAPTECWICRDTTGEPLIQPCACRGSMSGVHASCVEDWIRHHRRNAVNDEQPRCSVCHQHYQGYERRPGMAEFVRAQCSDFSVRLLRTILLVSVVMGYRASADVELPLAVRIVLIVVFSVAALHKVVVLTVSLPPHRPPPRNPQLRWFFVADYQALAMHLAETFVTMILLTFWALLGQLGLPYFLPVALAALVPLVKTCARRPSLACLRRYINITFCILFAPVLLVGLLGMLVWRNPRRAFLPFDAPFHMYFAVAAIPLCLAPKSDIPVLVLWATHSALIIFGFIDLFLLKKFQWKEGPVWFFTLQLSAFSVMVANACTFPEGWGSPDLSDALVRGVGSIWFLLLLILTAIINKSILLNYYRTWQRRHGTFTLQGQENPRTGGQGEDAAQRNAPQQEHQGSGDAFV